MIVRDERAELTTKQDRRREMDRIEGSQLGFADVARRPLHGFAHWHQVEVTDNGMGFSERIGSGSTRRPQHLDPGEFTGYDRLVCPLGNPVGKCS